MPYIGAVAGSKRFAEELERLFDSMLRELETQIPRVWGDAKGDIQYEVFSPPRRSGGSGATDAIFHVVTSDQGRLETLGRLQLCLWIIFQKAGLFGRGMLNTIDIATWIPDDAGNLKLIWVRCDAEGVRRTQDGGRPSLPWPHPPMTGG